MNRFISILFLIVFSTAKIAYCADQQAPGPDAAPGDALPMAEFIEIVAGELDYMETEGLYYVRGGARINFRDLTLETAALVIDPEKRTVRTQDRFVMSRGELFFSGEAFEYDFGIDAGVLSRVTTRIKDVNFSAAEVEVTGDGRLVMKDVMASTCCLEDSEYHVRVERLDLGPDGRASLKKISAYFRGRRLFSWRSYSMDIGNVSGGTKSGVPVRDWVFSPPSLGYSDYGGVEARAGLTRVDKRMGNTGVYFNYYARDGMFTEARHSGSIDEHYAYSLRFGKQYKENTGYFRYFGPVVVWNEPSGEFSVTGMKFPGTRIEIGGSIEAGRMREEHMNKALERVFTKGHARLPLNGRSSPVRFSILGDARYGVYKIFREYRILGNGLEMETGRRNADFLRLQYMRFRHSGKTPFLSDLVNTNDKLFVYASRLFRDRDLFTIDSQYDMNENRFDEIVYSFAKKYDCLKFGVSWRSEIKRISFNMQILKQGGDK